MYPLLQEDSLNHRKDLYPESKVYFLNSRGIKGSGYASTGMAAGPEVSMRKTKRKLLGFRV